MFTVLSRQWLSACVLTGVILFLLISGAGIFPWSVYLAVGILSARALWQTKETPSSRWLSIPRLFFLLFFLLQLVHVAPWPQGSEYGMGQMRRTQNRHVVNVLSSATEQGLLEPLPLRFSLSRNRAGSWRFILWMLGVAGAFSLAAYLPDHLREKCIQGFVYLAGIVAFLGILHQWVLPAPGTLWWFIPLPHGRPVGAFVSRTHHAGFLALATPAALFFAMYKFRKRPLTAFLNSLSFLTILLGILLSLSRGAWLVTGITISLLLLFMLADRRPGQALLATVFTASVLGTAGLAYHYHVTPQTREHVRQRFASLEKPMEDRSAVFRQEVWRDSLRVWSAYPVIGCGPNAFRSVYHNHREGELRHTFTHVENEYLQLLAENGALGILLAAGLLFSSIPFLRQGLREVPREVRYGMIGMFVTAALHNGIDFPARAPLYAFTLAAGIGTVWPRHNHETKFVPVPPGLPARTWLSACVFLLLMAVFVGSRPLRFDHTETIPQLNRHELAQALTQAPTSWHVWYHLGQSFFHEPTAQAMRLASDCMETAARLNPNHYRLWEQLGYIRYNMGDTEGARAAFERMRELRHWKRIPALREGPL